MYIFCTYHVTISKFLAKIQLPLYAGDDIIDKEEYRKAYAEFGLKAEDCDKAYDSFTDVSC